MRQDLANNHGFSLIEALIAIVVISVGLLALGTMQIGAMKANTLAQSRTIAVSLAQSQLDFLRTLPFDNALLEDSDDSNTLDAGFENGNTPDNSISDVSGPNGEIFQIFWNIQEETPVSDTRTIRLYVTWEDQKFGPSKVILTSVLGGGFYL
nr:prepilin-type N-terminal cleavage/methylation domain-containing protein [uncultured Desulfuromonas sp.]